MEYCQAPWVLSLAVTAMPLTAEASRRWTTRKLETRALLAHGVFLDGRDGRRNLRSSGRRWRTGVIAVVLLRLGGRRSSLYSTTAEEQRAVGQVFHLPGGEEPDE